MFICERFIYRYVNAPTTNEYKRFRELDYYLLQCRES